MRSGSTDRLQPGAAVESQSPDAFWGEISPCDHLVQFYESPGVFLDTLEAFIAGGLRNGDSAIVIATPDHLQVLEARLDAMGFDVRAARAASQLITIDAEVMLGQFMVDGWPSEDKFRRAVTDLLDKAGASGRKVRAFGEMVALLWARGHYAATVRLEHLWHKLCNSEGLSLFCAYPKVGFIRDPHASLPEICAVHTRVFTH